jgi:hypothetical protein
VAWHTGIKIVHTMHLSVAMFRTINPSGRCVHINEILNESTSQLHSLRRIKYYRPPYRYRSPYLSCFYDDTHFCLCTDLSHQRLANLCKKKFFIIIYVQTIEYHRARKKVQITKKNTIRRL